MPVTYTLKRTKADYRHLYEEIDICPAVTGLTGGVPVFTLIFHVGGRGPPALSPVKKIRRAYADY